MENKRLGRFLSKISKSNYISSGGKSYDIEIGVGFLPSEEIVYDRVLCLQSCVSCINFYSGGCGAQAVDLNTFKKSFKYAVFIWIDFFMKDFPKHPFVKSRCFDSIGGSFMDFVHRRIQEKFNFPKQVRQSRCRGCSPCPYPVLGFCLKPDERQFSWESIGTNVGKTLEKLGHRPFKWLFIGQDVEVLSKVAGFFTNSKVDIEEILKEYRFLVRERSRD